MGFFFFFNYSKYLNQTYFLINKPLNSYIKHALLAKANQGKSNTQPQPTTQNTQKNTEPEPNKLATRHPMSGVEGQFSGGYGYRTLPPTKLGIRAYFKVPKNYKNTDPRGLVRELYLSKPKIQPRSLLYVSTNWKVTGTDTDGKEVIRHWVDINPAAEMVCKNTSWHIETTSSTIRIYPVTKDVFVSQ